MVERFAVLGWGSLIWDLDDLAPHVTLPWQMSAGPSLPMEFTRISAKRKMGLAVCLDPEHGDPCPTHAIASVRVGIAPLIEDLARRERTIASSIGAVCSVSGRAQGADRVIAIVRDWCSAHNWSGAVWTDLGTNYTEARGNAFSVPDAVAYLRTLTGESLDEAVRYIENAPKATNTPLRRALATQTWWQNEAERLRSPGAQS